MNEKNILHMCDQLGWRARVRGDWVSLPCIFAEVTHDKGVDENPSFGISIHADKESLYNCMACGKKGPLSMMPIVMEQLGIIDSARADEMRSIISNSEKFSDNLVDDDYFVDVAPALSEYILERFQNLRKSHISSRGITAESVERYNLRWDRAENRIVFPIRDERGRLVGLRGRFIGDATKENVPRYKEYVEMSPSKRSVKKFGVWYGDDDALAPDKAIVLVEGEIDLIRFSQELPRVNIRAAIGASIAKEQLKSMQLPAKGIIAFFDNDLAGQRAFREVKKYMAEYACDTPLYRITQYSGCNDPDEIVRKLGKEGLVTALQSLDKVL